VYDNSLDKKWMKRIIVQTLAFLLHSLLHCTYLHFDTFSSSQLAPTKGKFIIGCTRLKNLVPKLPHIKDKT